MTRLLPAVAIGVPVVIIGFAVTLGAWWFQ